jgi:hypothetical protein
MQYLFPLDGGGGFAGNIVGNAGDARDFVDDVIIILKTAVAHELRT